MEEMSLKLSIMPLHESGVFFPREKKYRKLPLKEECVPADCRQ